MLWQVIPLLVYFELLYFRDNWARWVQCFLLALVIHSYHWQSQIAGLKDQLETTANSREEKDISPEVPGPDLLVGSIKAATKSEIMASLPPRSVADKLVTGYFETADMGSCELIHCAFICIILLIPLVSDVTPTNIHEGGKALNTVWPWLLTSAVRKFLGPSSSSSDHVDRSTVWNFYAISLLRDND